MTYLESVDIKAMKSRELLNRQTHLEKLWKAYAEVCRGLDQLCAIPMRPLAVIDNLDLQKYVEMRQEVYGQLMAITAEMKARGLL